MDKKRIIFIILFAISSIVLALALYFVFFRKPQVPQPQPSQNPPGTQPSEFPQSGAGTPGGGTTGGATLPDTNQPAQTQSKPASVRPVQAITKDSIVGVNMDKTGHLNFYNQLDGKFYRFGSDGKPKLMSDKIFYDVQKVTWSPTKNASILEYPDGTKTYYDFDAKRQVTLPKYWEEFSFSPEGEKIAAKSMGYSPENRWLITSNPDGTNVNLVTALGQNANRVTVDWSPNRQIVGTSLTGHASGADRQELLFIGLNGENFKSTIVEGRDVRSAWSPDGNKLLYSAYSASNDYKPQLWIVNASGDNIGSGRKLLNVETWADKCAFAGTKTVYCGVPSSLDSGVGFAPALADGTRDQLIKIDVETGAQTFIPFPDYHVIDSINISPDGKELYFTDKTEQGIFNIHL